MSMSDSHICTVSISVGGFVTNNYFFNMICRPPNFALSGKLSTWQILPNIRVAHFEKIHACTYLPYKIELLWLCYPI